nr:hypothetical protein OHB51_24140 [Micromonospora sp. NBC_00855]
MRPKYLTALTLLSSLVVLGLLSWCWTSFVFLTNLFRANYGIGAASASPQPSRPDTRPPTAGCAVRTPCLHLLP